MKQIDIEQRVRQIICPMLSQHLRAKVLASAFPEEHLEHAEPSITWSDRLWFSRGWRLAFVGAALVSCAVEVFPLSPRSTGVASRQQERAQADARVVDDAAQQLGLPPDLAASLARRAQFEAEQPRLSDQDWTAWPEFGPAGERR